MPIHDWTQVDDGVFHDFHHLWISSIRHVLNAGLLPPDYYAMADQVAGPGNPDVLGLQRRSQLPSSSSAKGISLAIAAPRVRFHDQAHGGRRSKWKPKRIAVRHKTGDRVVALIEIVSPGNKSSRNAIHAFVQKLISFIDGGIHMMILDLFPPGPRDPNGIHPLVWSSFKKTSFELPADKPLTLAAYLAGAAAEAFIEPVAIGDTFTDMPLFLTPDEYVSVPLEAAYQAAWREVPGRWREVLELPKKTGS
jgi:hypothetical protein